MLKEKLVALRRNAGYTQQNVADLLGVERSTYACYESGKATPPLSKIELLSIIYQVNVNTFVSSSVAPLSIPAADAGKTEPALQLSKEERILVAKFRLLKALGKEQALQSALEALLTE